MTKTLNKMGFASILEVIVSSIIFMIAAVGFFSSVSMLRPQATDSTKKLLALHTAKQVVDDLRAQVYGNMWTNAGSPLRPGVLHQRTIGAYTINYILTDVPGMPLRQMVLNIQYPD